MFVFSFTGSKKYKKNRPICSVTCSDFDSSKITGFYAAHLYWPGLVRTSRCNRGRMSDGWAGEKADK